MTSGPPRLQEPIKNMTQIIPAPTELVASYDAEGQPATVKVAYIGLCVTDEITGPYGQAVAFVAFGGNFMPATLLPGFAGIGFVPAGPPI